MKTALTYGVAMAIAGAVFTLLLYFAGFHDSVEKMNSAKWIGVIGGIAIGVGGLALAMREKRAQFPVDAEWGYGSALGAGVLAALFASLFGLVTTYVYFAILNPGFGDVVLQAQLAAMGENGMPAAQIDKFEPMFRKATSPVALTIIQAFGGLIWSVLLALVVAVFFRRRPAGQAETALPTDVPPPLDGTG